MIRAAGAALSLFLVPLAAHSQTRVWVVDGPAVVDSGSATIVHLGPDGSVHSRRRVPASGLARFDEFGRGLASLGDLDGDGAEDLAIGTPGEDAAHGLVQVLFLENDGRVLSRADVDHGSSNVGSLGRCLARLGDLDGDGVTELAAGSSGDADLRGAVRILFLNADGSLKASQTIGAGMGGFGGVLDIQDFFGSALAALGDLDGDGVTELAVGAPRDDDGGGDSGALWILFLDTDGTVKSEQKISRTSGGFAGTPTNLGESVASLGDLDGDGLFELAVGAPSTPAGGGAWVLELSTTGTVSGQSEVQNLAGGAFGSALVAAGDLDSDGRLELAVGARAAASLRGRVHLVTLNSDGTSYATHPSIAEGALPGDGFGVALTTLPDLDGDGVGELAVGADRGDTAPGELAYVQEAIDLAHSGDLILVRGGTYANDSVNVVGKSLTVQVEAGEVALVTAEGATRRNRIAGLGASQSVRLRGLSLIDFEQPALSLEDNAGTVWLENGAITASFVQDEVSARHAVDVRNSSAVALLGMRCTGADAQYDGVGLIADAGDGLRASAGSSVHAYECRFEGGDTFSFEGVEIGVGTRIGATEQFFLSGGELVAASMGVGLSSSGVARVLDTTFSGPGTPTQGSVTFLAGESLDLQVSSPVREGETIAYSIEGPPLVQVWLATSLRPGAAFFPGLRGSVLIGRPPSSVRLLGTTDASGSLQWTQTMPLLPASLAGIAAFVQPYYRSASGSFLLGRASAIVGVDASF